MALMPSALYVPKPSSLTPQSWLSERSTKVTEAVTLMESAMALM
eukprot:CAMPEP_0181218452 /NCGR_PEP_ID=MMETSP1096-20121128/27704_1 /TAXON_ID=156174 ORGANISM="Chrysochromulina ericina, Strain CCMP281" /NCGR_SAMPLE_ID=MMETSP1096 /ASSEMBLY_ACC=CAM_ASM_000453 /LENGTH=43 /DNA_ID= /DNA_START= /DNA_END= /DNA_ORIENTATION=